METGTFKKFFVDRGFGFVSRHDGQGDLFFHVSAVDDDVSQFQPGDAVEFLIETARDGRLRAVDIRRAD